jgi:ribonuclease R
VSKPPEPKIGKAKRGLPSAEEIAQFVASSPGVVGKRDIGRAFGIKGNDKILLKKLLKHMADAGTLKPKRKRLIAKGGIPPVAVIEIGGIDKDGDVFGFPVSDDETEADDKIKVLVEGSVGKAPTKGDRVLAKVQAMAGHGPYSHRASVMRLLTDRAGKLLAVFRVVRGEGARLVPVEIAP